MAEKVLVSIVNATVQAEPSGWHIDYQVHNPGPESVWLIDDENLVFKQEGTRIELSFARARMQPGVAVFGYFDPQVVEVPAKQTVKRAIDIAWPLGLSGIWNATREVAPAPGNYEVQVRVGFALTPQPPSPEVGEHVEAPIFRWQEEASSPPVSIEILPYDPTVSQ